MENLENRESFAWPVHLLGERPRSRLTSMFPTTITVSKLLFSLRIMYPKYERMLCWRTKGGQIGFNLVIRS